MTCIQGNRERQSTVYPKMLKELEEVIPKFVTIISEKSKRRCWKTGKELDLNIQDEGRGKAWRNSAQLNCRILAKVLEHIVKQCDSEY